MYIKLTKLDNSPIWLNAAFIVTIERGRHGGALVVPIGDGLDYDVRESPDAVLAMLADAPAAAVVPVSTRDALVPTPPDVSPEPLSGEEKQDEKRAEEKSRAAEAKAAAASADGASGTSETKDARTAASEAADEAAFDSAEADWAIAAVAGNLAVAKRSAANAASVQKAAEDREALQKLKWRGGRKPKLPLDEEQVGRLRKMMPKSVNKLRNTLKAQFKVDDVDKAIRALDAHGVISLDESRISWPAADAK